MSKYKTLVNILDQLRQEAPPDNKRYLPLDTEIEKLNQARARAFIHLYLKVRFGILDFKKREDLITDDSGDGGIDAYYIDEECKKVYFIQSKFRINEDNFQEKQIELNELLNMDVGQILKGEHTYENGTEYNKKIKGMQKAIFSIGDIGRYNYEVVILANLHKIDKAKLKKLVGGFPTTIFNHIRTYNELVFPVVTGTYYNPQELRIYIDLSHSSKSDAITDYAVATQYNNCKITVLFVPTIEIAQSMYRYKNSILKYNPRSYLELSKNAVNKDIAATMTGSSTNEFAILNNGITMLSSNTFFNHNIGKKDTAQLIITDPQIINGGQTAFTLSRLYERNKKKLKEIFDGKEVLLKVITCQPEDIKGNGNYFAFIQSISKATNQQTPVDEADRRSNDQIQVEIQNAIYEEYGYFYERKRGEFADGIKDGYIDMSQIIKRNEFIRVCKACDFRPSEARSTGYQVLFKEENFTGTLNNVNRFKEYFFAYMCYKALSKIEKKFSKQKRNKFGVANYGSALRYGKFAVVSACMLKYKENKSLDEAEVIVNDILSKWLAFESWAIKNPDNEDYLKNMYSKTRRIVGQTLDANSYYKGRTLNSNLLEYFKKLKKPHK